MHGAGMIGDLLVLSFYMIGAVIWIYFWLLCVIYRKSLFGPMTGVKWLALVSGCFFTTVVGFYLAVIESFSRDNADWWLVLFAALSPVIGIQFIRRRTR